MQTLYVLKYNYNPTNKRIFLMHLCFCLTIQIAFRTRQANKSHRIDKEKSWFACVCKSTYILVVHVKSQHLFFKLFTYVFNSDASIFFIKFNSNTHNPVLLFISFGIKRVLSIVICMKHQKKYETLRSRCKSTMLYTNKTKR